MPHEKNTIFDSKRDNFERDEDNDFLYVTPVPEDWGGDGRGRINLSGRCTAISKNHVPRQYYLFDTNTLPEYDKWQISGINEKIVPGKRKLLSWHESGASTSKVVLPPEFEAPSGIFTADLELFILKGTIQLGEWQLNKHGYSFIPAGVKVGPWKVLNGEEAEILWMENGPVPLIYKNIQKNVTGARLNEFIPALDTKLLPWGKTETFQFEVAKKKSLRKNGIGGGTWLLAILPHYDGLYPMIQSYNEEAYGVAGYCDIGNSRFAKDHYCYCSSFSTLPRHQTEDGSLSFVRVDRDISQLGTVLSYTPKNI